MSSEVYPDLSQAKVICVDVETHDPNLFTLGPGGVRDDGFLLGVGLAVDEFSTYLPLRHEPGDNLNINQTRRYLNDILGTTIPKLGANIGYDLEWLRQDKVTVAGPKYDIQVAEPLLDENLRSYSLDALAKRYLGEGKRDKGLYVAGEARGLKAKEVMGNLHKLGAVTVGHYCKGDVELTLKIWALQEELLKKQDLGRVFKLETDMVDVCQDMRWKGVRVDLERAGELAAELETQQNGLMEKLFKVAKTTDVDIWSGPKIAAACDSLDLTYPFTPKGAPSFAADWIKTQPHPFFKLLTRLRKLDRAGVVFVQDKIINAAVGDRLHPSWYSLRQESMKKGLSGTRTGRLSCANPNLQQIPARDSELAPKIRSCFVPEDGQQWLSADYSQIEPRITVHYASLLGLPGADEAVRRYRDDPNTDYHQMTCDLCEELTGVKVGRTHAKTINLGLTYGMQEPKLAVELGVDSDEAQVIFSAYHKALPFVAQLSRLSRNKAGRVGVIKTVLGRRRRFIRGSDGRYWYTYRALNNAVQGSAADLMKQALVDLRRENLLPNATIHDEGCSSISDVAEARRIREIMVSALKFQVPLAVDLEIGPSWGEMEIYRD